MLAAYGLALCTCKPAMLHFELCNGFTFAHFLPCNEWTRVSAAELVCEAVNMMHRLSM